MIRIGTHSVNVCHAWTGAREFEDLGNGDSESRKQEVIWEPGRSVGIGMKGWGSETEIEFGV